MAATSWQNRITRYGEEPPDQLLANPRNFRTHPKHQQDALSGVLSEVGVVQNIIVNERTGHLIDGHLRVSLAMREGQPTVPVTYVDLSPEEEALILATLDPISALATTDAEQLDALLREVSTSDAAVMQMLSDLAESAGIVDFGSTDGLTDPDDVPEPPAEPITQPGDLWLLGRHRLLCGDSTVVTDVDRLMAGEKADMVFTDPPYGTLAFMNARKAVAAKVGSYKAYANNETFDFEPAWDIIKGWDCPKVIWGGNYFAHYLPITTGWIVWDKRAGEHSFFSDCELAWTSLGITAKVYSITWQGMIRQGETGDRVHPTQKPIELGSRILNDHSAGDLIIDLFGGSGSTLIACEQTGRRCAMMELDPIYCDVIVRRWEAFTGETAVRETAAMAAAD